MACETIRSFAPTVVTEFKYTDPDNPNNTLIENLKEANGNYIELDKGNKIHRKLIRHLYRRIGYGASLADIEYAHGKTIDTLVNNLINNANNITLPDEFDWGDRNIILKKTKDNGGSEVALPPSRQNELISNYWTNESIIGDSNSVRAKLMLFWHDHFVIEAQDNASLPHHLLKYFKVLFNNAFGNFKTFVEEIGRTPAMLSYLNGYLNEADPGNTGSLTPDENYARELMELFTMGEEYKKLDINGKPELDSSGKQIIESNYTKADVNELARALSGWTFKDLSPVEGEFRFRYGRHDWTLKTLLSVDIKSNTYWKMVFGEDSVPPQNLIIPNNYTYRDGNGTVVGNPLDDTSVPVYNINQVGVDGDINAPYPEDSNVERAYVTAGDLEYKAIHEIIFTKRTNAIAYFICRKLYEFYIYGDVEGLNKKLEEDEGLQADINLTILDAYIESLAETFKANWNITPVLKRLFKSQHFFDAGIIGAQIKSPFECGTSIFRAANLQGGWGEDSLYDYQYKLQLLNPGTNYTVPMVGEEPDTDHPNYREDGINWMTGEGIDTNGYIEEDLQASHAYASLQETDTWELMYQHCGRIGQKLFDPPNVAGWETHQLWLNAFTWIKRREMATYFLTQRFPNTNAPDKFRNLAIELLKFNYPTDFDDSGNVDDSELYTNDSETTKVIRVVWKHFISVEPTDEQIKSANASYTDNWDVQTYGHINIYPDSPFNIEDENSLWNRLSLTKQKALKRELGIRVMNMVQNLAEQPEFQLN